MEWASPTPLDPGTRRASGEPSSTGRSLRPRTSSLLRNEDDDNFPSDAESGSDGEGDTKSKFRGVSFDKKKRKWRVQIKVAMLGKSGVSVGYFDTEEEAARAYDRAAIGLLGRDSCAITTNYPMSDYDSEDVPKLQGKDREEVKEILKNERAKQQATPRRRFTNRARTSKYIGVGSSNRKSQWQARILVHGKVTHLGYYKTEEEAARVYDKVSISLHGTAAHTNFPISSYTQAELDDVRGLTREELQRALGVKPMDKSSRYRGVSKKKGKWEAKVMVNRKWAYRELFNSEVEAAKAYDAALRRLKPNEATAYVNFKPGDDPDGPGTGRLPAASRLPAGGSGRRAKGGYPRRQQRGEFESEVESSEDEDMMSGSGEDDTDVEGSDADSEHEQRRQPARATTARAAAAAARRTPPAAEASARGSNAPRVSMPPSLQPFVSQPFAGAAHERGDTTTLQNLMASLSDRPQPHGGLLQMQRPHAMPHGAFDPAFLANVGVTKDMLEVFASRNVLGHIPASSATFGRAGMMNMALPHMAGSLQPDAMLEGFVQQYAGYGNPMMQLPRSGSDAVLINSRMLGTLGRASADGTLLPPPHSGVLAQETSLQSFQMETSMAMPHGMHPDQNLLASHAATASGIRSAMPAQKRTASHPLAAPRPQSAGSIKRSRGPEGWQVPSASATWQATSAPMYNALFQRPSGAASAPERPSSATGSFLHPGDGLYQQGSELMRGFSPDVNTFNHLLMAHHMGMTDSLGNMDMLVAAPGDMPPVTAGLPSVNRSGRAGSIDDDFPGLS